MVRLAHLADAPVLAQIESRAWREAYASLLPQTRLAELEPEARVGHWRARLRSNGRHAQRSILVSTTSRGTPVGYASVGPADHPDLEPGFAGEVFELYVDPDHQGRGVGRALLEAARNRLRQSGFGWLVIEVLADNDPARGFYAAQGLVTEGRTRRRPSGARAHGQRYSLPGTAVRVVRYETSLWTLDTRSLLGPRVPEDQA